MYKSNNYLFIVAVRMYIVTLSYIAHVYDTSVLIFHTFAK